MKIIKFLCICIGLLSPLVSYSASISKSDIVGTWKVKNETVDPIYTNTRGEVTFNADGTLTVDKGAFAAAGIAADNEYSHCGHTKGPIRYKKIGKGEFYLYWEGKQYHHHHYNKKKKKHKQKLDAVLQLVRKRVNADKEKIRLTFIGDGGCAKDPGVHRISYLKKKIEITDPPEPTLACLGQLEDDPNACKEDFFHIGADQALVVPEGATYMRVKMWGAGGNRDNGSRGGVGGYTTAIVPVVAGDEYSVVVGRWGNNGGTENYGFGGSGGGLSGIFTGDQTVLSTDQARAIMVAGGGGASSDGNFGIRNGQDGNDPSNLTVVGDMAASCRIGRGGGGGGYEGGEISNGGCSNSNRTAFGYGGSGFIAPNIGITSGSIETGFANCGAERVPANYLDADWQRVAESACIGPGTEESGSNRGAAVLVEWFDELPSP